MPLETASFIDDLVSTNPADTDNESQGAAHLRLIKACVKASLPNLGDAAMTLTAAQLNAIGAALVGSSTTVNPQGLNGTVPMGTLHTFARDPGTTLCARGGAATGNEQFILLDGATYAQSKFPNLGASVFVTAAAPNFTVDNLCDTGRFIRAHVPGTTTPGTKQANQNLSHNHVLTDPGHDHVLVDNGHSHGITDTGHEHTIQGNDTAGVGGSNNAMALGSVTNVNQNLTSIANLVALTSTTGVTVNSATSNIAAVTASTGITLAAEGGNEARPESYIAFVCIKT